MHTSLRADIEPVRAASRLRVLLLYVLCGSVALYPLLEKFVAPVIAVAYAIAGGSVALRLLWNGLRVPRTYLNWVWGIYAIVYAVWYGVAELNGNNPAYIRQDSFGFLLYFGALPILFLYVRFHGLEAAFARLIVDCSTFIAGISVAAVGGYFFAFGPVEADTLLVLNTYLAGLGLAWHIDSNGGVLGVYTYTAHLLLLGVAVELYRYTVQPRAKHLALVALYLTGILLDGHRALVVAGLLQLLIVSPRLLRSVSVARKALLIAVIIIVPAVAAILNLDWLQERFNFTTDDPSTAERYAQIPALLDKIAQNPVLGSGFGSFATYIRSIERPFSYEVDVLATVMKLGAIGSLLYFGTYMLALLHATLATGRAGVFLLSAGLPFLFYMGTNGNQAMSTDSAVFHIFLFLLIEFTIVRAGSGLRRRDILLPPQ